MTDFEQQDSGAKDREWFYAKYRQMHGKLPGPSLTYVFLDRVGKYLECYKEPDDRLINWAYKMAWGDYLDDLADVRPGNGG